MLESVAIHARKLYTSLAILSIFLLYSVILRHRDFMTTMNVVTSAASVGVSSLLTTSQPQDASTTSGYSDSRYDWDLSTEENYRPSPISQTNSDGFVGDFKEFRLRLDRSYHTDYVPERQFLQDSIIRSMLLSNDELDAEFSDITVPTEINKSCEQGSEHTSSGKNYDGERSGQDSDTTTAPWIVFTAGVYGAGKSHTIKELQSLDCFPPGSSFVKVDPDEIRRCLPSIPCRGRIHPKGSRYGGGASHRCRSFVWKKCCGRRKPPGCCLVRGLLPESSIALCQRKGKQEESPHRDFVRDSTGR